MDNHCMEIQDIRRARLAHLIESKYGSQAEFIAATGQNQGEVSALLRNKSFGEKKARRIEEQAQLPPGWLDAPDDESLAVSMLIEGAKHIELVDEDASTHYHIPRYKLQLQAGVMGFQPEPDMTDGGTVGLSRTWVERRGLDPSRLISTGVRGESMEPTFYEGDTVVINLADTKPIDNGVFAVNYDGEAVIKRMSRDMGAWWLMSDNPDQRRFYRRQCHGAECIIIGRVVWREGDHF